MSEDIPRALVCSSPTSYPHHCTARETSERREYALGTLGFDATGYQVPWYVITTSTARYYIIPGTTYALVLVCLGLHLLRELGRENA